MEILKLCRVCLIMDVKMYDLQSYPLSTYVEPLLVGNELFSVANSPPQACYECAQLIKKFYFFRQKFYRSQAVLYGLRDISGQVLPFELKQVDRKGLLLKSSLSESTVLVDSVVNEEEAAVKVETESDDNRSVVSDNKDKVKENALYLLCPDRNMSSDDDEPLSVQKKKKIEVCIKGLKEEDAVNAKLEKTLYKNVGLEDNNDQLNDTGNQPPKVRKPGHPRKHEALKRKVKQKRKSIHGAEMANNTNLGDYITVLNLTVEEQMEELNKRKESSNYLKSPYQCELCYKGFLDANTWKHHVAGKHAPTAGDLECHICKFRFKTKRAMRKHTLIHEKKYACKSCPYISSSTTQANRHQGWHKGVTYKCKFCEDVFTVWTSYMSHMRIKHPSEFICGICGYSYVSKLGLTQHKTMMHKDVMEKGEEVAEDGPYCKECDVKFVSMEAFKRHIAMSTKHTETNNGCRTCGEDFKNAEELRIHHRKEHAKKRPKHYGIKQPTTNYPAKCEHCSEEVSNGREYWLHYRRAHPDKSYPIQKNYVCDVCGKGFRINAFLLYHKRTHTQERPYKCDQCDKAFNSRTNLQEHQTTHSESRPYPCSVCLKAFKWKGALSRHSKCHTDQKPYKCDICGKAFTQANLRKIHITTVHMKQPAPYVSRRRARTRHKETIPLPANNI